MHKADADCMWRWVKAEADGALALQRRWQGARGPNAKARPSARRRPLRRPPGHNWANRSAANANS